MEKQTDFRIRSYGRTELAQLYNPCLTPKAAYRKLVGWIDPGAGDRRGARRTVTHSFRGAKAMG